MLKLCSANPLSVLVVDDDELMQFQVQLVLEQVGIDRVTLVSDAEDALSKLEFDNIYDLIILDLNMPVMSGTELLRRLAAMQYTGAIALFSGEDPATLRTAGDFGAMHNLNIIGALQKPISIDSIHELLADPGSAGDIKVLA